MTYYPGLVHYRGLCDSTTMDYNVGFIHPVSHRQHLFSISHYVCRPLDSSFVL